MSLLRLTFEDKPAGELVLRPSIALDRALLCGNCDRVYEAADDQSCPACGSAAAMLIAPVLNRETASETAASQQEGAPT